MILYREYNETTCFRPSVLVTVKPQFNTIQPHDVVLCGQDSTYTKLIKVIFFLAMPTLVISDLFCVVACDRGVLLILLCMFSLFINNGLSLCVFIGYFLYDFLCLHVP